MNQIINIAAYKFVLLDDLKELRRRLHKRCTRWELKGTILLSTEGINLFMAGERSSIDKLLAELRGIPGLEDLSVKESLSDRQPFHRMLVRIKQEIIAFGVDGVSPLRAPAPRVSPRELKQWLDEGRPVTLLDTRNNYEIKLGTFHNAVPVNIDHFRYFPEAVRRLPEPLKDQTIVTFCTGGIRCEKAAPFMRQQGFRNVFQLDGGILRYFEECGGTHYDGECFVFDQRVALDAQLCETATTQCYVCQEPLTLEEQQSPGYVLGESCPYCYRAPEEQLAVTLEQRQAAIDRVTRPLPGSQPYENQRPIKVPERCEGQTLIEFLCEVLSHVPRTTWQEICEAGQMVGHGRIVSASHIVHAGERYCHVLPGTIEPDVNAAIRILYEDSSIIVVHKPAPLPMHPSGRFHRNTLSYIMREAYRPHMPRVAHRLDANTTGVVVLSRTHHVAGRLQPQFERREVGKVYLARVQGHPAEDRFVCDMPISERTGHAGFRGVDADGLEARTEFDTRQRYADGTALIEVRPLTGRTNQIRVHLWHLGLPICGDPLYLADGIAGEKQTLDVADPPLCLHAWSIQFRHPVTGQRVQFAADPPQWASVVA